MFKQHLEMIGRNETASKKAKFWQSYIRSLKGSDDIRAQDAPKARTWRSDYSPAFKSIYDEPSTASERITGAGYRYLPVHRDTYGYSPRAIYSHHYNRPKPNDAQDNHTSFVEHTAKRYSTPIPLKASTYETNKYDAEKAWKEHQDRMKEIERRYPSRYGLYLKDKPSTSVVPLEYEPEDKPARAARALSPLDRALRAASVPSHYDDLYPSQARASSRALSPLLGRGLRAASLAPLDSFLSEYDDDVAGPAVSSLSPTPVKSGRWGPRASEVAYNPEGSPVFRAGWVPYNSLMNLRDPYLDYLVADARPFSYLPAHLRNTYLSPARQALLW